MRTMIRNIEKIQEFKKLTLLTLDFNNLGSGAFVGLKLPRLESLSINNNRVRSSLRLAH